MAIKEAINRAIVDIKKGAQPNPLDSLALSLFLGGEDTSIITDGIRDKINNVSLFSNYRNSLTILSPMGENFIIGETIPITIKKYNGGENKGLVLTNIELLCLCSTPKVEGNTPIEVILGLDRELAIEIVRSTELLIEKEPIIVKDKEDLVDKVNDRTSIKDSEVIFYFKDSAVLMHKKQGEILVDYIPNLSTNTEEIIRTNISVFDTFFI